MNPTGVSLQNLSIETPGSEIKKSAVITYPSLAALQKDPGVLGMDIDLQNSKISIKDLQTFLPALSAQNYFPFPQIQLCMLMQKLPARSMILIFKN